MNLLNFQKLLTRGIEIIQPGFYTSVQDKGRLGYAHLGIPESGAMDQEAYALANTLLNNDSNAAALECTLIGPEIKLLQDVYIAITGASSLAQLDGKLIEHGVPVFGRVGQILKLSRLTKGSRCYIAFAGGIDTSIVLGSRSFFVPITKTQRLFKGMILPLGTSFYGEFKGAHLRAKCNPMGDVSILNVFCGPEYKCLTIEQKETIEKTEFTVSSLWNRMAVQLDQRIVNSLDPIQTSPVLPGTVQLTPSGKVVILAKDGQITGGYPRILQLSTASMHLLGQMCQGNKLRLSVT